MKARINLSLSKLSGPAKIEKGRHIVTAMTGNSSFTTPIPTLVNVSNAINAYETAYNNAQGAGPVQTALMHEKEAILDNILSQLGNYVEITANGVESIILSAGMSVRTKGGKQAFTFTAISGKHPGELELHAKSIKRGAYLFEMVCDPLPDAGNKSSTENLWKQIGVSIQATFTVSNLSAGIKYWFRYATVNKDGQSAWSDPISKIVSL